MKKLLILFLVPLFAISQTNPNREYWQTNKWSAKKGMNTEFEAAVAKKLRNTTTLKKPHLLPIKLSLVLIKENI